MPIHLPNLDDRTFNDLVEEAKSLIPKHAPEWTNHNPSDPGITIIELFAYLTEILIFRLNQVTDENLYKFLELINGPEWSPSGELSLKEEILNSIREHREINRAITYDDFIKLTFESGKNISRVHCVPNRNLNFGKSFAGVIKRPGHVSLIVLTNNKMSDFRPGEELKESIKSYLDSHRLLTTRIHVVGPSYLDVKRIRFKIFLKKDEIKEVVSSRIDQALSKYFHPLEGGSESKGWPFGRSIYISELFDLLEKIPGADYIEKIEGEEAISYIDDVPRKIKNKNSELIGIKLHENELVRLLPNSIQVDFE